MNNFIKNRRFIMTQLHWLIDNPTDSPTAGLTGYREELGMDDLFSVFVRFESPSGLIGPWKNAKIFSLAEDYQSRLPSLGGTLVLTAGVRPVALAKVLAEGEELIQRTSLDKVIVDTTVMPKAIAHLTDTGMNGTRVDRRSFLNPPVM